MVSPPPGLCHQLEVTWTAPSISGVKYKILINGTLNITSLSIMSTILNNLKANTEYTVVVVAFTKENVFRNATGMKSTRPKGYLILS